MELLERKCYLCVKKSWKEFFRFKICLNMFKINVELIMLKILLNNFIFIDIDFFV